MPESRKRKPTKKASRKRTEVEPGQYRVGTLRMREDRVGGLVLNEQIPPDLMVELLMACLWLYHNRGMPANSCVNGAVMLRYAYEQFGIVAEPRAVDLAISDQRSKKNVFYGRPDPYWDGPVFHGHCVLFLPGSGRLIDATVEQYPQVRRYDLGPICGRSVAVVGGTAATRAAFAEGGVLPAGHQTAVQRGDLMLLYTLVNEQYEHVLLDSAVVRDTDSQYRRAGINLASDALLLLRREETVTRTRLAPYPRLQVLLDAVGDAEHSVADTGDIRFHLPQPDGSTVALRLDELPLPAPTLRAVPTQHRIHPAPGVVSTDGSIPAEVQEAMDSVETTSRVLASTPDLGLVRCDVPAVLFEPLSAVGMARPGEEPREMQVESILLAGFERVPADGDLTPPALPGWSVRQTTTGLELWDEGGLWARSTLDLPEEWRTAAKTAGVVAVVYGPRIGVRRRDGQVGDDWRSTELATSRQAGAVAAALVPFTPLEHVQPRTTWWSRLRVRSSS